MKLGVLSLNCQKNYNPNLSSFLKKCLKSNRYDIFLLQEATKDVLKNFEGFTDYRVVDYKIKDGRHALCSVVFDSRKFKMIRSWYEPIFIRMSEDFEKKKSFQSFGVNIVSLKIGSKSVKVASVHLPSGASRRSRVDGLVLTKELVGKLAGTDICFYGGDCNFCFPGEVKNLKKIVSPDYACVSSDLGTTLDSYYTESHLPVWWIKANNLLRRVGVSLKFKTDHFFIDVKNLDNVVGVKVLKNRVSDHSPVEMILKV